MCRTEQCRSSCQLPASSQWVNVREGRFIIKWLDELILAILLNLNDNFYWKEIQPMNMNEKGKLRPVYKP